MTLGEQIPARIWLAAGLEAVSEPLEVTDAFSAAVRGILWSGGTVQMYDDKTLAPLARYIARELADLPNDPMGRVEVFGDADVPVEAGALRAAVTRARPDAIFLLGGGAAVRGAYTAGLALPSTDGFPFAQTGADAARMQIFAAGEESVPTEVALLFKAHSAFPTLVREGLNSVHDRISPRTPPRLNLAGLRRVLNRSDPLAL